MKGRQNLVRSLAERSGLKTPKGRKESQNPIHTSEGFEFLSAFGVPVVLDSSVPPGTIEFRTNGRVALRITNVATDNSDGGAR